MYGLTPAPVSKVIRAKLTGGDEPITDRPGALLPPCLDKCREEIKEYIENEEDVLSYVMFPNVAVDYFKFRQAQRYGVDPNYADKENKVYPI
jgi:oxaloacetate decarboxylase alpha subunit